MSGGKKLPLYELYKLKKNVQSHDDIFINLKTVRYFLKHFTIPDLKFDFIAEDAEFCLSENEHIIDSIKNYLDEYFNKENKIPFIINNQNSINIFKDYY